MTREVVLEFDGGVSPMTADLVESPTADGILAALPRDIELQSWGDEAYGPLGLNLVSRNLQSDIEAGGLAYTDKGDYLCIFFGQRPAWPVEYIGRIQGEAWRELQRARVQRVRITQKETNS